MRGYVKVPSVNSIRYGVVMEERTVLSLLRPEAYDDSPLQVVLKQTHVSYIFITDRFVYKIKKPVDFGFLNFTTVDRRRFYCEEEVRLNRRLSPDVYLGVVELRGDAGKAGFTGDGQVIDYAVKMKRLPETEMLDRVVDEGRASGDDMVRLARVVAEFHQSAERGAEINLFGSVDSIRQNWDENFRLVSGFTGSSIPLASFELIQSRVTQFMAAEAGLFEGRVEQGFIRDCDGDLHLANICLGDEIRIFDCIEFNNRFRYIDTASDIAFLLMDLDYHSSSHLAQVFIEEYCKVTGDTGCLDLLDFYKIYRAFVRGKVAALTSIDPEMLESDRREALEASIRYFRLASGYILRQKLHGSVIMVAGLPGSGKSTFARQLGVELGLTVLSSDRIRKGIHQPETGLKEGDGSDLYSSAADSATYSELCRQAALYLQDGGSVIVDATFRRRSDRDLLRRTAGAHGASVWLAVTDAPKDTILQRLEERKSNPDRYSDAGVEVYRMMVASYDWPDPDLEPFVTIPADVPPWLSVDRILNAPGFLK